MAGSKINRILTSGILFVAFGCTTSSYRPGRNLGFRQEIWVTPDRVVMSCTRESDDGNVFYGFMIHVLDDQKTVLDILQGNRLDKDSCLERIQKIGKILTSGNRIFIGGMGTITEPRTVSEFTHTFPRWGTYHSNGRILQFAVIANERGACYSAHRRDEKPCPRDEFPIGE